MKLVMMTKLARLALMIFLAASLRAADAPAGTAIDPQKSSITVRVFKAGVFSAFGHEHEISAPIQQGSFTENPASVELIADTRGMRVMDKGISEKDRADIQQTMLGPKVLDSEKFPTIRFRSTRFEPLGEGKWIVLGDLTIHGETRPVKVKNELHIEFEIVAR